VTSPESILAFWFAGALADPDAAQARSALWFGASPELDASVRERFAPLVERAARGELASWLAEPPSALALVIALDQFPRNIWRGSARAFAHDARALAAAEQAVAAGHLARLSPLEGAFLILPYQHSESAPHQRESVELCKGLVRRAPPAWRALLEGYLGYAEQHRELIERFGRFPHRNRALGRTPTDAEQAYLAAGGATFGQGTG
jgi:uncharacterized protein (DUF924 family)